MPRLAAFEGRWRIARRIEDEWSGVTGLFEGIARFTPDGLGLAYHEMGELKLPQEAPLAATRRYLWREDAAGIDVLYEDGRPFHRIATDRRISWDQHDCAPDSYEVTYTFAHWPEWRMIWKVRGPRKDYVSITDYRFEDR